MQMQVSLSDIKAGDFVDVRAVALSVDGSIVTVRIPGSIALHQLDVGAHTLQHVEPRSPEAIAADVVCSSYAAHLPHQLKGRAKK
jgi:hypothetical protein